MNSCLITPLIQSGPVSQCPLLELGAAVASHRSPGRFDAVAGGIFGRGSWEGFGRGRDVNFSSAHEVHFSKPKNGRPAGPHTGKEDKTGMLAATFGSHFAGQKHEKYLGQQLVFFFVRQDDFFQLVTWLEIAVRQEVFFSS